MKWQGVFPAITTKFNEADDSLALAALESHIEAQIEAGIHGLVMAGSLGENSVLNMAEKLQLLKTAKAVCGDRIPVVLTVGSSIKALNLGTAISKIRATASFVSPSSP